MPPGPGYRDRIEAVTDHGRAEFVPDAGNDDGWTLLVDGIAQSYVRLDNPRHLEFVCARMMVAAINAHTKRVRPREVLHLGGGGLTLPRYLATTSPGSRQWVVEYDGRLLELVSKILPLRGLHGVELIREDARTAVEESEGASVDVVISDVFATARMPSRVGSVQFLEQVRRVLREDGLYVANVAVSGSGGIVNVPLLTVARIHVATARIVFDDVCALAEPSTLRGRRYGNVVIVGCRRPLPVGAIARLAGREARVLHGEALDAFVIGAGAMRDA